LWQTRVNLKESQINIAKYPAHLNLTITYAPLPPPPPQPREGFSIADFAIELAPLLAQLLAPTIQSIIADEIYRSSPVVTQEVARRIIEEEEMRAEEERKEEKKRWEEEQEDQGRRLEVEMVEMKTESTYRSGGGGGDNNQEGE
jgi:hypothetical protein